jgi:hypothetical protein
MDPIVEAAMRKWPRVPHCHGWLALDARGQWYMRDDAAQAAGDFPAVKGSMVRHDKLREFIHRNYLRDAQGAAYFQNGPQRVYVDLEVAPYVWRIDRTTAGWEVRAHTGELTADVQSAWLDEAGRLFLQCLLPSVGPAFGIVHTLDMAAAADAVEAGHWDPRPCCFDDLPARFGYVLRPRAENPA